MLLKYCNEKVPKIPDYTCTNPDGEMVAIEYERTIKSKKRYKEVIEQYMQIKERGVIKQVIYFTEDGFAGKLRQLFIFMMINSGPCRYNTSYDEYFNFKSL